MDIKHNLTTGAINVLISESTAAAAAVVTSGVFQILGLKKISTNEGDEIRYRLNISDGLTSYNFVILPKNFTNLITDGILDTNCIIKVDKFTTDVINNIKLLIIIELEVLANGTQIGAIIGNPVPWIDPNVQSAETKDKDIETNPDTSTSKQMVGAAVPSSSSTSTTTKSDSFMPICDITSHSTCIGIRVQIIYKSDKKYWSNARGSGSYFTMSLLDNSGEIKATAFNNEVDKFFDFIEINNMYCIDKYEVRPANMEYNTCDHAYEIIITKNTKIFPSEHNIKMEISYNFIPFIKINGLNKNKIIDVLGICKKVGGIETIKLMTNNSEVIKRDLILIDQSNIKFKVTLWGKAAEEYKNNAYLHYYNSVIAIKNGKLNEYNNEKYLSIQQGSLLEINPDISETYILKNWFESEKKKLRTPKWMTMHEAIAISNRNIDEYGIYFMCKVTLMDINRNNYVYMACPFRNCNKKVSVNNENGLYHCVKCNEDYSEFKWRYIIMAKFADYSNSIWASCFSDSATYILESTATAFVQMDSASSKAIIDNVLLTEYICKFKITMGTYQDKLQKKYSVFDIDRINHFDYGKRLVNEITEAK